MAILASESPFEEGVVERGGWVERERRPSWHVCTGEKECDLCTDRESGGFVVRVHAACFREGVCVFHMCVPTEDAEHSRSLYWFLTKSMERCGGCMQFNRVGGYVHVAWAPQLSDLALACESRSDA